MAEQRLESETGTLNFVNYVENIPLHIDKHLGSVYCSLIKGGVISILGSPVAMISMLLQRILVA